MPRILINDEIMVKGQLAISIDEEDNGGFEDPQIEITGQFITHGNYENIDSLESERYFVNGVIINKRLYDANDFNITYLFTAKEFEAKGGVSDLEDEVVKKIEEDIYEGDYDNLIRKAEKEVFNG